jgi:hypothetical protein
VKLIKSKKLRAKAKKKKNKSPLKNCETTLARLKDLMCIKIEIISPQSKGNVVEYENIYKFKIKKNTETFINLN